MSVSVGTTAGNQVSVTIDGQTLLSFTTEESSVNVVNGDTTSVTVTERGAKGDTGETGATGATGPAGADGADGQGVPTGGLEGQALFKSSATDYDTAWDYVESTYLQVENAETTAIAAGTVVYAFGVSGANITVKKADASTSSTMPAIGVVLEEIPSGGRGEIITSGLFNKTISGLSGINVGDTVYVSETAGEVTTTKPTGTALIQNIGVVLKTNGSNIQKMKVSAIDRVNDIPNLPNGQAWIGNASGVPIPTTLATVATTGAYSDISGTPSLATVATTGAYSDLTGTPSLATVATTGSYNDLTDQPTIPTDTYLGNTNQTLSANRVVEMNGNTLDFQNGGTSEIKFFSTGTVQMNNRLTIDGDTANASIRMFDSGNSNAVTINTSGSMSGNVAITLPTTSLTFPTSAGSSGQVMTTDGSGNLSFSDHAAKTYGSITCGFFDDISTLVHYLPLNGPPTEINSDNNSYTDWLCPCDIVVKSVQMRFSSLTGSGNLTMTVEKDAIGSAVDTDVESETVAISGSGDNQDVVHFLFDNAAVSAGEKLKIKIQADADITGSSNTFVVVVYEADWSTRYTQASGIITS